MIAHTIAAVNTPKGKKPPKIIRFMPDHDKVLAERYPRAAERARKRRLRGPVQVQQLAQTVIQLHHKLKGSGPVPEGVKRLAAGSLAPVKNPPKGKRGKKK